MGPFRLSILLHACYNSDDFAEDFVSVSDVNFFADGIASRKKRARENIVDDADFWRGGIIGGCEFASGNNWNSHCVHVTGRHAEGKRGRIIWI